MTDIFSELEGLRGENLCSAVLRLLLLRSQDLREQFVVILSREHHGGPLSLQSHFSCTREEPTFDPSGRGRLDLLLELDNAVVGIENKLQADFQGGQPQKYLEAISQRAKGLTVLRGRSHQPIILILAPEDREPEIGAITQGGHQYVFLSWDTVLNEFRAHADKLDRLTAVLLDALDRYVAQHTSLFPDWTIWLPHLCRVFEPGGTALQKEVVGKLAQFFPDPGTRLSAGDVWCGYYFTDRSAARKGWYGFLPKDQVLGGRAKAAELIVATSFGAALDPEWFAEIELKVGSSFLQSREIFCWAVQLDSSWQSPDVWRQRLRPLLDSYDELRQAEHGATGAQTWTPDE